MSQILTGVALQRVHHERLEPDNEPWDEQGDFTSFAPGATLSAYEVWPQGGLLAGADAYVSSIWAIWFDAGIIWSGSGTYPYFIRGFARDSTGAVLGNARIDLYRTSDKHYLRSALSDSPSGQYNIGTDDAVTQHFIVTRRYGPDIQGVTIDTLVGS